MAENQVTKKPRPKRDRTREYERRKESRRNYGLEGHPAKMERGNATMRRLYDAGAVQFNAEGEPFVLIVSNPTETTGNFTAYPILVTDLAEMTDRGYREIKHELVISQVIAERQAKQVQDEDQRLSDADARFLL